MTTVEARLRSWAGNLRNGAYRQRVLEAADEIKRLSEVNAELLAACRMVKDDPGLTAAANEVIRAAVERAERITP